MPALTASAPHRSPIRRLRRTPRRRQSARPARPRPSALGAVLLTQGTRSAAVRKAIVREQAAQRAEELAKSAEDVTKADRAAASEARQKTLVEANEASRRDCGKTRAGKPAPNRRGPGRRGQRTPGRRDHRVHRDHWDLRDLQHDFEHHPDRRTWRIPGSGCGDRCALRPVRHMVALSHRAGLPRLVRHPDPRGDGGGSALRRQLRRLGREPCRDQARRRPDDDVLAHVIDGGARRPESSRQARSSAMSARRVARSGRICTSSCTRSGSSTGTSTRRSIPVPGWPRTAFRPTDPDRSAAPVSD